MFGTTVQLYVTPECGMNCEHCRSRLQRIPNMTPATLKEVVEVLKIKGVRQVEEFANDPILSPHILEHLRILDESGLNFRILTVGDSPHDPNVKKRFSQVMENISRERGGFVFSVDFTEKTAKRILFQGTTNRNFVYAFKADTFWELAPSLQAERISVRVNIAISRYNIDEVVQIIQQVVKMGFAVSFCFVQTRQQEFDELSKGVTQKLELEFREYLRRSNLLTSYEIEGIIEETYKIVARNELEDIKDQNSNLVQMSPFNAFRGTDRSEGEIPEERLIKLRHDILTLKSENDMILPGEDFISNIGNRGFGCIHLIERRRFPQMKIGPEGQIWFCCDLHDPCTSTYLIGEMREKRREDALLESIRTNPYIWICTFFNPCDFSVNHVTFDTST